MDDPDVASWNEMELILNVNHELRRAATVTVGYAQLLAQGSFGFVDPGQQEVFQDLYKNANDIRRAVEWIHIWLDHHKPGS